MDKSNNFNHFHPELQVGESFKMNCKDMPEAKANLKRHLLQRYPFSKVRFGSLAFTPKGEKVPGFVPVFVVKSKRT